MEFSVLFDVIVIVINDLIYIGDFNCDLMLLDKLLKDGCDLFDLLEIYNFKNLIEIFIWIGKMLEILFDFIFINNIRKILIFGGCLFK